MPLLIWVDFCWFFSLCFSLFNEGFAGELRSVQKKTVWCKTSSGKPGQQHDIAVPSIDMIGKMLHQQKLKTGDSSPCIKTKNTRSIHDCVLVSSKSCVWSNMKHNQNLSARPLWVYVRTRAEFPILKLETMKSKEKGDGIRSYLPVQS